MDKFSRFVGAIINSSLSRPRECKLVHEEMKVYASTIKYTYGIVVANYVDREAAEEGGWGGGEAAVQVEEDYTIAQRLIRDTTQNKIH